MHKHSYRIGALVRNIFFRQIRFFSENRFRPRISTKTVSLKKKQMKSISNAAKSLGLGQSARVILKSILSTIFFIITRLGLRNIYLVIWENSSNIFLHFSQPRTFYQQPYQK